MVFWNVTSSKSTAEQAFETDASRDEEPPPREEKGTPPVEGVPGKAPSPRHHRPRERYREHQCLRDACQKSVKKSASVRASAKGRQAGSGSKPEEKGPHDHLPESKDNTDPVDRAPGGALVPKVPPVEEALRIA